MTPSRRGRGRPLKNDTPMVKKLTIRLSDKAYRYVKAQYKGWLPDLLERLSKQGPLADRFNREAREEMLNPDG